MTRIALVLVTSYLLNACSAAPYNTHNGYHSSRPVVNYEYVYDPYYSSYYPYDPIIHRYPYRYPRYYSTRHYHKNRHKHKKHYHRHGKRIKHHNRVKHHNRLKHNRLKRNIIKRVKRHHGTQRVHSVQPRRHHRIRNKQRVYQQRSRNHSVKFGHKSNRSVRHSNNRWK